MKNLFSTLLFSLSLLVIVLAGSCSKDSDEHIEQPPKPISLTDQLKQEGLYIFSEGLFIAGLESEVNATNLTLFAPTDSTMQSYLNYVGVNTMWDLRDLLGQANFKQMMRYHFWPRHITPAQISTGYVSTLATNKNQDQLHCHTLKMGFKVVLNQSAQVLDSNLRIQNLLIHKINAPLTPLTLNGLLRVNSDFSELNKAVSHAGGDVEVWLNQSQKNYTLFAPSDAAFYSFLSSMGIYDLDFFMASVNKEDIRDILKQHLLGDSYLAQQLQNGMYNTLRQGYQFEIIKDSSGSITIKDTNGPTVIKVTSTNVVAVNGTMHTLNRVMQ